MRGHSTYSLHLSLISSGIPGAVISLSVISVYSDNTCVYMHIICGEAVMCSPSAELQRQGLGQARLQTDTEAPEYELSCAGARLLCLLLHTFSVFRVQSVTLFHTVCLELCKYCSGDKISTKIATEL